MQDQKITQLDKTNLQLLRKELQSAVQSVAEKYGLKVDVGNCTYTPPSNAKFQLMVATVGDGGVVNDQFRTNWDKYAPMLGLDKAMLDQSICWAGKTYKVVGLNPNKGRYPVLAERADGKRFFLPTNALTGMCDAAKAA